MFRYICMLTFASLLLGLTACEKETDILEDPNGQETPVDRPNFSVTGSLDARILLDLVNEKRLQGCTCGTTAMPPVRLLEWDPDLERIAHDHSIDMDTHQNMSHTGSDGSSARDRLNRANYSWRSYGENVAWNYRSEAAVFNGWINSAGHCLNIMSANKQYMGVAQEGWYWTMLLTKK